MQAGYVVFFVFFPLLLEGCCVENDKKKSTGLQGDVTHYKTVTGEIFVMPCLNKKEEPTDEIWFRSGEDTGRSEDTSFRCGRKFLAEPKHSGTYTCLTCGSKLSFRLQVVEKNSLKCFCTEESSKILRVGAGGEITCPGLNCSDNNNVKWYQVKEKGIKAMSEQRRPSCEQDGWLRLCQVHSQDTGVYFCDRQITEQGATWIFRRAVNVTTIRFGLEVGFISANLNHQASFAAAPDKPSNPPRITHPGDNSTEEVELGQSHTLACQIHFPPEKKEKKKLREVQWYVSLGGNMESMKQLENQMHREEEARHYEDKFTQTAVIKEVKLQHLNNTYTCFARNSVGNNSVTVKLKNKKKVRWRSLIGYPVAPLLLLAGLGILLHVKRLDLQLIFRYYFQLGKHNTDDKKFDVLLSYMWSPTSELEGVSMPPSKSGPENDEEALSSMDPRNLTECYGSLRPLEVLLPQVLEDQWGYRLCLLERDVLPGGAYTNDIVLAIQRSQMLICLLSADYLSDSNAVFVLESGVQALLNNSTLKLLLIWINRSSACQFEIDPPLPTLVQRALKVLPSLDWTSGKPVQGTRNFWRSLQKAMPQHRVQHISH